MWSLIFNWLKWILTCLLNHYTYMVVYSLSQIFPRCKSDWWHMIMLSPKVKWLWNEGNPWKDTGSSVWVIASLSLTELLVEFKESFVPISIIRNLRHCVFPQWSRRFSWHPVKTMVNSNSVWLTSQSLFFIYLIDYFSCNYRISCLTD